MRSKTKTIGVIAVVLFVLLTCMYFFSSFRKTGPPTQVTNPYRSFGPSGEGMPGMPDMMKIAEDQAKVFELMSKYNFKPRLANYIAQSKMQILNQTDTSVHLAIIFPDQTTLDETATITADPTYIPTSADPEKAARKSSQVQGVKMTHKKTGPQSWSCTLQYHVPYVTLPAGLQQKIQPASGSTPGDANFFDLVPRVYASEGEVAGFGVISVVANYFAEYYKDWKTIDGVLEEFETAKSLGADVPLALVDLLEDGLTYNNWMNEMNALENCVKNPTNPLAKKAKDGPNYQHEVLDQMSDAKGDVESTAVPMLASDVAGYLSHFLPFGGGAVTTLLFSTQDDAVSEYAEGRISEAKKYLVPCEDKRPGRQSSFEFAYSRKVNLPGNKQDVNGTSEGSFEFKQDPRGFPVYAGEGQATIDWTESYVTFVTDHHLHFQGPLAITATGRGNPRDSDLDVDFSGDQLAYTWTCSGKCNNRYNDSGKQGFIRGCKFHNVDLVRGGSYSAPSTDDGTGRQGTCKIKIPPQ